MNQERDVLFYYMLKSVFLEVEYMDVPEFMANEQIYKAIQKTLSLELGNYKS